MTYKLSWYSNGICHQTLAYGSKPLMKYLKNKHSKEPQYSTGLLTISRVN